MSEERPTTAGSAAENSLFAEGLRVAEDHLTAQQLFAAAWAADGLFHAPVLAEAETWLEIGNLRQARNAAQRAKDLARRLSVREERETEIALARDEGAARLQIKALYTDWPDDPALADALVDAASTAEEGRAVLRRWREASPLGTFSFLVEQEEATLLVRAQGAPAADPVFERLEEKARALGATLELAKIRLARASSFARSDPSRAVVHIRQARRFSEVDSWAPWLQPLIEAECLIDAVSRARPAPSSPARRVLGRGTVATTCTSSCSGGGWSCWRLAPVPR